MSREVHVRICESLRGRFLWATRLRERVELRVQFVAQEKKVYPVSMLCRVMGVSRSGFYDYEKRVCLDPDPDHQDLVEMVRKISESSDHTYGARHMSRALKALGYEVGRRRARTLMRVAGIWVRYRKKYRVTTNSRLACDALQMAIWTRRPEEGLIFHSDRGVQYASHDFRRLLKANGILGSMSRKGDCWDNSVVESFFGKLKSERVHCRNYHTRSEARADVVEYITMRYNSLRLHSYLGYLSPDEFERRGQLAQAA